MHQFIWFIIKVVNEFFKIINSTIKNINLLENISNIKAKQINSRACVDFAALRNEFVTAHRNRAVLLRMG